MKYSIIAAGLVLAAAVTLTGCAADPAPAHEATSSSSNESERSEPSYGAVKGYGGGIPVADVGRVAGHCQQLVTFGGTWVLPPSGIGPLVWAPSAKHSGCVILPGQVPVAVTPAAGAPAVAPVADYVILGGHCTVTIKTSGGTVWAMPDSGLGELTRVTEPATVACRKAVN